MRSKGLGHEMYFCQGKGKYGLGVDWTFNIAEAIHWNDDRVPTVIVNQRNSLEVSVVAMTRKEYFIRKLKGK